MKLKNLCYRLVSTLNMQLIIILVGLCSSQNGLALDYEDSRGSADNCVLDPEYLAELQEMFPGEGGVAVPAPKSLSVVIVAGKFSIGIGGDTKGKRKLGRKAPAPGFIEKDLWRCPKCDYEVKGRNRSGNMTKHMRTHTGEKPYGCLAPGCDKCYRTAISLAEHAAAKHTSVRLICGIDGCAAKAGYVSNLQKHQRNDHPEAYAAGLGISNRASKRKHARLADGRD